MRCSLVVLKITNFDEGRIVLIFEKYFLSVFVTSTCRVLLPARSRLRPPPPRPAEAGPHFPQTEPNERFAAPQEINSITKCHPPSYPKNSSHPAILKSKRKTGILPAARVELTTFI
ncbi:hypothetical protein Zmor_004736 [Zophobas morio]|uniref:Uncharacterized protein n=1 Tax=Zophobas morio TaxID=2755281 RepID=A0AA38IU03_9CUCU|nr:hypothetical protein Zmor_004736 [Zophobas morio]